MSSKEDDSSSKMASSLDMTLVDGGAERRIITQAEADVIFKKLNSECESQAALKM